MKFFAIIMSLVCVCACSLNTVKQKTHFDFTRKVARVAMVKDDIVMSTGTAVLVEVYKKTDHYELMFITAKHVVRRSPPDHYPVIQFFDYGNYYQSEFLTVNITDHPGTIDLSILVTASQDLEFPIFMDSSSPTPLDEVLSIGFSRNIGLIASEGLVSNPSPMQDSEQVIWICTAPVYPGGSGGAVVDRNSGKLLGMTLMVGYDTGAFGQGMIISYLHFYIPAKYFVPWIKASKAAIMAF